MKISPEKYHIESSFAELWTEGIRKGPVSKISEEFIKTLGPSNGDIILDIGAGEEDSYP